MTTRIKKHVEKALSSGFLAVTLVWGVAAFVVSTTPVSDSGEFRAYFPSGSSSSTVSESSVSSASSVSTVPSTDQTNNVSSSGTCSDTLDNEGDIAIDAADPDCDAVYNICNNSYDDDGDGLVDGADVDCDEGWM